MKGWIVNLKGRVLFHIYLLYTSLNWLVTQITQFLKEVILRDQGKDIVCNLILKKGFPANPALN